MSKEQYTFLPNYLEVYDYHICVFNIRYVLILFCIKKVRSVDAQVPCKKVWIHKMLYDYLLKYMWF